jgi:hypothetical protein
MATSTVTTRYPRRASERLDVISPGTRINVYWNMERAWYMATVGKTVISNDGAYICTKVKYDDGQRAAHDLYDPETVWNVIPSSEPTIKHEGIGLNKSKLDKITSELQCPICLDTFNDPWINKACGHIYCKSCIEEWLQPNQKRCPVCNMDTNSIRNCSSISVVNNIVDIIGKQTLTSTPTKVIAKTKRKSFKCHKCDGWKSWKGQVCTGNCQLTMTASFIHCS